MASKKISISSVKLNNKPADVAVPAQCVDTVIIDGVLQPDPQIVNGGVKQ